MTERTRKIIDSAWVPLPNTEWPNPGAQMIAREWRYPRWGCDTVQRMVDMMDELVRENERLREGRFAASDAKEKTPSIQAAMNERSAFKIINDIPELQSLCYDCDILPEQVMDNPAAVRAICVIAALYLRYDDNRKGCVAEVENLKRLLRNIEGDCFDALTPEHINAIGAAIGRVPTPEGEPAPSPEDEEVWDEKLQQEFLNASKEKLGEMLADDGLDYDELARKGRELQERLKKKNEERKAGP